MITKKGLEIMSKYMLGHTQSYATHIAIGCGAEPTIDSALIFTPITRELVSDGGTAKATLTFTSHNFQAGEKVVISGIGSYFDGTHTIQETTSTSISYYSGFAYPTVSAVLFNSTTDLATITTNVDNHFEVGDFLAFISIAGLDTSVHYPIRQIISPTQFVVYDASSSGGATGTIDFAPTTFASNYCRAGTVQKQLDKRALTFEMERFPITVRGIKNINGVTNLLFSADIPTQERYGMTEIGVFSGLSNSVTFDSADSKSLLLFTEAEPWQIHGASTTDVATYTNAISVGVNSDLSPGLLAEDATFIKSSNSMFLAEGRVSALEQPRMYDSTLVIGGDLTPSANIVYIDPSAIPDSTAKHIHLITKTNLFDFSKNNAEDTLTLAFSLLKANATAGAETTDPTNLAIKVVFTNESPGAQKSAMFSITEEALTSINSDYTKRYYVITRKLNQLVQEEGFSWMNVDAVKIFVYINNGSNYMVAFDGMRFENVFDETLNPSYGLIAYSTVSDELFVPAGSETGYVTPLAKNINTQNIIEYAIPLQIGRGEV
jgi:hypothetical protein